MILLTWNSFNHLHLIWKGNELLARKINFYYQSKYTVVFSKFSYGDITSFSFNNADFPPLSSKSSTVNSLISIQSPKLSSKSIFQLLLKSLLPSLF